MVQRLALLNSRLQRWGLGPRIAITSLGLLLLVLAAGWVVVDDGIERNARRALRDDLERGESIARRLLQQRAQTLEQGSALLAADWGFRDAVRSEDTDTIVSALENSGQRIGASYMALLDTDLKVRAQSPENDMSNVLPVLEAFAEPLARQRQAVARVGIQAWELVMVPLKAPVLIGWVVMAFPLDRELLHEMRTMTGAEVILVTRTVDGVSTSSMSTLDERGPVPAHWVLGATNEAEVHGQTYLPRRLTLQDNALGQVDLVLLGSVTQAVAPYQSLRLTLGLIGGLGLVLFAAGSLMTARRLTQPLADLVSASDELAAGHYDQPLAYQRRRDEIGDLARAFDHMRVSIASQREEVQRLAYWDRLTGLPNRLKFRNTVAESIARQSGAWSVLMLDLDRFKHVNDVLGYAQGDRLLHAVAQRLAHVVGPDDVLARLGGDEYAVLLPGGLDRAMRTVERITHVFEQPLSLDDQLVDLSAGIGIAVWPEHAVDADLLLSHAEIAMYSAKRRTAGAMVYDPSTDSASAQTLSLLSELRQAIDNGELRLFLQPKIALADGHDVVGAEALVRWQHPQRGLVPPMQFIPFAEQTGFIRQLTLWIFNEAARQQKTLQALGVHRVSVNLSTRDLLDLELPDKLAALLEHHGAQAAGFCLEITESAIMDDPQRAENTLNRLSQSGFKLSIDDFGTGYSSLAYLKRLPVNELKIDKSFVMAMERDPDDAKIVRSTIDLAHNLGLSVVAEGVENAAIAQALQALHCDEAQGYHYARPMPAAEFTAWARQRQEQAATTASCL